MKEMLTPQQVIDRLGELQALGLAHFSGTPINADGAGI